KLAGQEAGQDHRGGSRGRASPPSAPATVILSGLLPGELDATTTAFAPSGLAESDRRRDGDWAALLLRSG
ncbi:MAG TPA: hypothetical protein VGC49_02360, partial [Solirubrobacterales bacterium]